MAGASDVDGFAIETGGDQGARGHHEAQPRAVPHDVRAVSPVRRARHRATRCRVGPTLIVIGDKDTTGLRQAAELMAEQIPGAASKTLAGADHALAIGWAEQFNDAVLAFISGRRNP